MLIKELSEIWEEDGLDNVDPLGFTGVLESHSKPLSNEELHDLAPKLTEQQKEDEDKVDRGTKAMQTNDLLMFFGYRYGSWKVTWYRPWMGMQFYSKKGA